MSRRVVFITYAICAFTGICGGCKKKADPKDGLAPAAASAIAAASASQTLAAASRKPFAVPSGPRLAIYPGGGVGPIRIGATVPTIERHMEAPCEVKTEELCRYIGRAVEFKLKEGVVSAVHVHRHERPAGKDAKGATSMYGIFNGGFFPDVMLGMLPWAVQEHVGKPQRVEKLGTKNLNGTEELHYYDGMVLEYDRLPNGNLVLGGVRIP